MKLYLQNEATECGLASLAMVANHYGHRIDLNGMRQRFEVSLKGSSLQDLIQISEQLSIGSRAIRLESHDLENITLPAILHWDLSHFVVLKEIKRKVYYL